MWKIYILITIVATGFANTTSYISEDILAKTLAALVLKHNSKCVFVYQETIQDFCYHTTSLRLQKLLTGLQIQCAFPDNFRINSSYYCSYKQPMNVIVPSGSNTTFQHKKWLPSIFTSNIIWIVYMSAEENLENIFRNTDIPFDCEFIVAQVNGNITHFLEVYRIHSTFPLEINKIGNWTDAHGLLWTDIPIYRRRRNLHNLKLRIVLTRESTMAVPTQERNKTVNIRGFFGDTWKILQEKLNFTSEYVGTFEEWGAELPNNLWTGMIGALTRDEADVGLAGFTMTDHRLNVVEFLLPLTEGDAVIFIQDPNSLDWNWRAYLAPFKWTVWSAMIGIMLLLSIGLFVISYLRNQYGNTESTIYSFQDALFCVLSGYCGQGQTTPENWSCRSLYLISYLGGVVLMAAYSGTLISYLTVQQSKLPFETFEDILKEESYTFHTLLGAESEYFKNTSHEILSKLNKKFLDTTEDGVPITISTAIKEMCSDPKYALMATRLIVKNNHIDEECQLITLPKTSTQGFQSIALRKNSPYKRLFNLYLQDLRNTGVLSRLHKIHIPQKYLEISTPKIQATLQEVSPLFAVLIIGILIASFLLTLECLAPSLLQKWENIL